MRDERRSDLVGQGNTVEVVGPDAPVTVAVHRMATRNIGSLVVVGPDDQLRRRRRRARHRAGGRAPRRRGSRSCTCSDVVNPASATCTVTDDLAEVMRRMTANPLAAHARLEGARSSASSASATSSSTAWASSSSRPTSSATSTSRELTTPAPIHTEDGQWPPAVSGRREGDGEVVGAEDADGVGLPGDRAVESEVGQAAGQQRERLLQLGPGQGRAEAVVDARAERQLRLPGRLAGDVEPLGVAEHRRRRSSPSPSTAR